MIDGDSHGAQGVVLQGPFSSRRRVVQSLEVAAIEVDALDGATLATAPVQLATFIVEVELLPREDVSDRDDDFRLRLLRVVELDPFDAAILLGRFSAHQSVVYVARLDIELDAVGLRFETGNEDLLVGTVGRHGQDLAGDIVEVEEPSLGRHHSAKAMVV